MVLFKVGVERGRDGRAGKKEVKRVGDWCGRSDIFVFLGTNIVFEFGNGQ